MMDPLNFATLIGLLGSFLREHRMGDPLDREAFSRWLKAQRHEAQWEWLSGNPALLAEVDNFLKTGPAPALEKLGALSRVFVDLACRMTGFENLVKAAGLECALSRQAVSILRQFADSGARDLYSRAVGPRTELYPVGKVRPGAGGVFAIEEPRFLDDDMKALTAAGFLTVRFNDRQDPVYGLTRSATEFLELASGGPASTTAPDRSAPVSTPGSTAI